MAKQTNGSQSPISPDLLEILRDPQAIQEGARWKDTPVDALPVPPPAAEPAPITRSAEATTATPAAGPDPRLLLAAAVALILLVLVVVGLSRRRPARDIEQLPDA